MKMKRILTALIVGVIAIAGVGGCARRTIDKDETNSVEVPGTNGTLQKFCDGSILIYWTPALGDGGDDDYEFIVYDGCTADGRIVNGAGAIDVNPSAPDSSPRARTEDLQSSEEDNK
jgi:hypothetical protein